MREATAKSYNTVYAQVILNVGVPEVAEMAKNLGITSAWVANPQVHGPSYALGAQEVSPLDMASAFGVFANRGVRAEPTPVLKITDRDGKAIEDNTLTDRGSRVIEEPVADNMTKILKGVIEGGTGTAANIGRPAAGKTGTSQNWENAWFVGYTPTLSTAVWLGYREGNIPMRGVHGVAHVAGGTIPARIWHDYMIEAMKGVAPTDFNEPAPIESLAARAKREQRGGYDLGGKRDATGLPGEGPYFTSPPVPSASEPTTTTTTEPPPTTSSSTSSTTTSSSTTTTTRRSGRTTSTTSNVPGPFG